jgi:DNA-directed RNA polymerase subunit RPC12/RpoP
MAEVVRLKCFSCGASLATDERSLDTGYICPHCGSKNFSALSADEYSDLIQKSLDSFDYSVHVKMGELQEKIDSSLEKGDEKSAIKLKRELILWQIKAAPFMYKTEEHKAQAFDQMMYRWQKEYLDPKGKKLSRHCVEKEQSGDVGGFAKAMFSFQMYLMEGTPHVPESYDPKETCYRVTEYALNRFEDMTPEKKARIMASMGWKPETATEEALRCTNCGAALSYPESGSSETICPYCQSEVVVGTAYDALSAFTGTPTRPAQETKKSRATMETNSVNLTDDLKGEVKKLKEAYQGGSTEEIQKRMADLKEKIGAMKEESSFSGISFSYVFKSCPDCGSSVQVADEASDVTKCPHCGYTKGNGEKDG